MTASDHKPKRRSVEIPRITNMAIWGLACITWLVGCANSQDPKFTMKDEHYRPIFERQKAGMAPSEMEEASIPKFTREEYEQLGDSHTKQGNFVLAAFQYEKALEMDPAIIHTRSKVAHLYLLHGRAEKAYDRFHEIIDYDFEYAPAYIGMGRALLQLGSDSEAEQEFRQALVFDPRLWEAHNYLGIILDRRQLHGAAIQEYEKALTIQPQQPSLLNNIGMAYYFNRQYDHAAHSFRQAIHAGANNPKIWNNLGLTFSKLGEYDEAFTAFKRGLDAPQAYNNLGVVFLEAGKSARAVNCFEKAIEKQPRYYPKAEENLALAKRQFSALSPLQQRVHRQRATCL